VFFIQTCDLMNATARSQDLGCLQCRDCVAGQLEQLVDLDTCGGKLVGVEVDGIGEGGPGVSDLPRQPGRQWNAYDKGWRGPPATLAEAHDCSAREIRVLLPSATYPVPP